MLSKKMFKVYNINHNNLSRSLKTENKLNTYKYI